MKRAFFTAANLVDRVNPPKPNSTVVVENDRIIAVGPDGRVPKPAAGDTVFDLRGKSLMPVMVEGNFHASYLNVGMTDSGVRYPPWCTTSVSSTSVSS